MVQYLLVQIIQLHHHRRLCRWTGRQLATSPTIVVLAKWPSPSRCATLMPWQSTLQCATTMGSEMQTGRNTARTCTSGWFIERWVVYGCSIPSRKSTKSIANNASSSSANIWNVDVEPNKQQTNRSLNDIEKWIGTRHWMINRYMLNNPHVNALNKKSWMIGTCNNTMDPHTNNQDAWNWISRVKSQQHMLIIFLALQHTLEQ